MGGSGGAYNSVCLLQKIIQLIPRASRTSNGRHMMFLQRFHEQGRNVGHRLRRSAPQARHG